MAEQPGIQAEPKATGLETSTQPVLRPNLLTRARRRLAKVFETKPDSEYPVPRNRIPPTGY